MDDSSLQDSNSKANLVEGSPLNFDQSDFLSNGEIVAARGTENGLILRIDGSAEWDSIIQNVSSYIEQGKGFFKGGDISIEWMDRLPTNEQRVELEAMLKNNFKINVIIPKRSNTEGAKKASTPDLGDTIPDNPVLDESSVVRDSEKTNQENVNSKVTSLGNRVTDEVSARSLIERVERLAGGDPLASSFDGSSSGDSLRRRYSEKVSKMLSSELFVDEDANAKVVFGTLRSGQKVESPFSVIVVGDVNPGADIVSGGDILILGSLRGTAHAAAYDEEGFEKIIFALDMQPMQLRIGSVISRGVESSSSKSLESFTPELAKIDSRRIVVESYNPRKC